MLTTMKLVRLVQQQYEAEKGTPCTEYRAAKEIEVSRGVLSNWKMRGSVMCAKTALFVASYCKLDPDYVLICLQAERTKGTAEGERWHRLAKHFDKIETVLAVLDSVEKKKAA